MEPDDGAQKEFKFKFNKIILFSLLKLQIIVWNIWISKIIPESHCLKADLKKVIFNHSTFFVTGRVALHSHKLDVRKQRSGHKSSDILLFWRNVSEKQKQPILLPSAVSVFICTDATGNSRHLLQDFPSAWGHFSCRKPWTPQRGEPGAFREKRPRNQPLTFFRL